MVVKWCSSIWQIELQSHSSLLFVMVVKWCNSIWQIELQSHSYRSAS